MKMKKRILALLLLLTLLAPVLALGRSLFTRESIWEGWKETWR